jgi:hypothetical protein
MRPQPKKPSTRIGAAVAALIIILDDLANQLEPLNQILFRLYLQVAAALVTLGLFGALAYEVVTHVHH